MRAFSYKTVNLDTVRGEYKHTELSSERLFIEGLAETMYLFKFTIFSKWRLKCIRINESCKTEQVLQTKYYVVYRHHDIY